MDIPDAEYTNGTEVYHWPEFKALCARLGIAWGLPTSALTIRIPCEGSVVITQEYHGKDLSKKPDEPRVVDTTCAHNREYRTKGLVGRPPTP